MKTSLLAILAAIGWTAQVYAQDPFVETNQLGTTDWVEGYIEATGQGTSRYMSNRVQEELMAKQAARTVAQARLLEIIKGVRLTGLTTLSAHAQTDTHAATRIKGTLRGARVLNEKATWQKDKSSRRGEVVMAEVTLRLCVSPTCKETRQNLTQVSLDLPQTNRKPTPLPSSEYSSVIIDLNQALYLPALSPEVINEKQETLYSQDTVNHGDGMIKGFVHYAKSVEKAKMLEVAGTSPLIINVKKISSDNKIVLSDTDGASMRTLDALRQGRLIVALD